MKENILQQQTHLEMMDKDIQSKEQLLQLVKESHK